MAEPRRLIQARHFVLACFWTLPLVSLTRVDALPAVFVAALVAIVAWTIWRPPAGLLMLALLLPLGFAFVTLAQLPFSAARAVECALLSLLAGWSVHVVIHPDRAGPSRLALPVITMSMVVAASGLVVFFGQFESVPVAVAQLWRQVTQVYMTGALPPQLLPTTMRWLEVLALALVAERILHHAKSWSPLILATWIGAGTAVAAQTMVNVAQIALGRGIGWQGALDLFRTTRFGAIYPDLNGAGSIFGMLFLTAALFAAGRRRWLIGIVTVPVLLFALIGTQSRAALAATLAVVAGLIVLALVRRGYRVIGFGLASVVLAIAAAVVLSQSSTHVSAGAAWSSRVEMWRVAAKLGAEDYGLGVGVGRFQAASRDYLSDAFIQSFPEAAGGENAHNFLLQVLGEFGVPGLIAFVWLLVAVLRRGADAPDTDRRALLAGLAVFIVSAMFGHPLLIFEIAVAFFFALGFAAGLGSRPAHTAPRWHWALFLLVLVSLPVRALYAQAAPPPSVVGATLASEPLEGQAYYVADEVSQWRLRLRSRGALIPMRWADSAAPNCHVQISINGLVADEVPLQAGVWVPVPLVVPPGGRPGAAAEVELRVKPATCKLLVGRIEMWR